MDEEFIERKNRDLGRIWRVCSIGLWGAEDPNPHRLVGKGSESLSKGSESLSLFTVYVPSIKCFFLHFPFKCVPLLHFLSPFRNR